MGSVRLTLEGAVTTDPGQTPVWADFSEWWAGEAGTKATLCGRQTEQDRFNAGSLATNLDNTTRRFDPTNTAGPYYGNLLPMRRLRLRGAWNLLPSSDDSNFAGGVGSWAALANCSLSTTAAAGTASPTSLCLLLTKTGGSAPISAVSAAVDADPGTPYAAVAWLRVVSGVLPTSGRVRLRFYSGPAGTGTLLSTVTSADVISTSALWLPATITTVSPAGTASMRLVVEGDTSTNGNTFGAAGPGIYQADAVPAYSDAGATDIINVYIERFPLEYSGPEDAWVPISGVDAFKVLNLLTLPPSVYEEEVEADSPTHWWRLDDAAGSTTAADTGSSPTNGSITHRTVGSPAADIVTLGSGGITAGVAGSAMTVAGAGTNLRSVATFPVAPAADFTIEFLAQYTGDDTDTTFLGLTLAGGAGSEFLLQNYAPSGTLVTVLSTAGGLTASTAATGDVRHYAVTLTGSTWRLYVDGALIGNATAAWTSRVGAAFQLYAPTTNGDLTVQNLIVYNGAALSAARILAHATAALGTAWAGETTGARIGRYLDLAGWPAGDRSLDAGNSTVQAATTLGQATLAAIQQAEDTENGKFFVTRDNKTRFMGRRAPYTSSRSVTSQATFSDAGPLDYESITFGNDDAEIRNDVRITRDGGLEQTATDATSQGHYYARTYSRSGMLNQTDPESADSAGWLLAHFKDPLARIDAITISPYGNDAFWPLILRLGVGDRVTVVRHPPGGGTAITVDSLIEGVSHDFDHEKWATTYQLSQADTAFVLHGYDSFVLDTDVFAY